mgnify:FL=1
MTRNFVSAKPSESLHDCAKKLAKERVNSLLITEGKKLVGILTARDILWAITKKPSIDLKKLRAIDIAARKVAVIKPSADLSQALRKMKTFNFRRLPVLSRGEVIGVLTLKDILRIEPELYSEITEFTDIREEERKIKEASESYPLEGFCDNCGAFSELLKVYDKLLCPDCREELY